MKIIKRFMLMLTPSTVNDIVKYLEPIITEYDQQIIRAHSTISKLIAKACLSISSHGQPFHITPQNEWVSLDSTLPRLKIDPLKQTITEAMANEYDIVIVRPKPDFVDIEKYNEACYNVHVPIYNDPPYYNVFAYPKLMLYCLQVIWHRYHLSKLGNHKGKLGVNEKIALKLSIISELMDKIQKLTYCTQIFYTQYIEYGDNVFQRLYGVNFCRPKEQELLVKDGHYEFIAEISNGKFYIDSSIAPMYQQILKN